LSIFKVNDVNLPFNDISFAIDYNMEKVFLVSVLFACLMGYHIAKDSTMRYNLPWNLLCLREVNNR